MEKKLNGAKSILYFISKGKKKKKNETKKKKLIRCRNIEFYLSNPIKSDFVLFIKKKIWK